MNNSERSIFQVNINIYYFTYSVNDIKWLWTYGQFKNLKPSLETQSDMKVKRIIKWGSETSLHNYN
ncbi:hypothetical protein PACTADRAFT_50280, partial [Pachysolen tannophilus NRRL Y-2460]